MDQIIENKIINFIYYLKSELRNANVQGYILSCAFKNLVDRKILKDKMVDVYENKSLYMEAKQKINEIKEEIVEKTISFLNVLSYDEIIEFTKYIVLDFDNSGYYRCYEQTNDKLAELVLELLEINSGDTLFDLGAGDGAFLARAFEFLKKKNVILNEYLGAEINIELVYQSNMLLEILMQKYSNARVLSLNALNEDISYPYNKGYVYPPFGIKNLFIDQEISSNFTKIKFTSRNSSEWLFIDKLINKNHSSPMKRMVAITPTRPFYNDADKEYRNELLKCGLIEGIIELPSGTLSYSGIKVCLLVLSNNNSKVKFVDASKIIENIPKRFNKFELPIKDILNLYNDKNVPMKNNEELLNSSNLLPSNILIEEIKHKNGVSIGEIAEVFTGTQYTVRNFEKDFTNKNTGYKILTSSDIDDGVVKWKCLQSIDFNDKKFDKYAVLKNDVIITSKSSKVKTVVVDIEPKEKILVTGGMIIVRPDISKVNPTYLKIYLDSDQGKLALRKIQRGQVIISINAKDLKEIEVPLINIEKQNSKAEQYNNKLSTLIAYKKEIEKIENKLRNFYYDEEDEE